MDYDQLKSVLGVFWSFTTVFIGVSIGNAIICTYYLLCSCRFNGLKAKDPQNLALIFFAGQCQSWGHYFYSLPVYKDQWGAATTCLAVGYILQHFLGTLLLFYALISRLVKSGAIFHAFEVSNCCKIRNAESGAWNRLGYMVWFKTRYRVISILTLVAVILPMMAFVTAVYTSDAISIDDNMYCTTQVGWKIVFVCINATYFVGLTFLLCFVPRFIKEHYHNESKALTHAILYSVVVFCLEIWISFNNEYESFTWTMISNGMTFSIHTFVIFRLFFYRFWKACQNDKEYELSILYSYQIKQEDMVYWERIVIKTSREDPMCNEFLKFIMAKHKSDSIAIHSPEQPTLSKEIRVESLITFIDSALELKSSLLLREKTNPGPLAAGIQDMTSYREIVNQYVEKNMLPLTDTEGAKLLQLEQRDLNKMTFSYLVSTYMKILFQNYFAEYAVSDAMGRASDETRMTLESSDKARYMYGIESPLGGRVELQSVRL